jgi:Uma2 family endonuclease
MAINPLLRELQQPDQGEQLSFEQWMSGENPQDLLVEVPEKPSLAVKAPSPATGLHQDVRLYLTLLLKTFVEMTDAGLVRDLPYEVRLSDSTDNDAVVYCPDIVFVSNSSFDRVYDAYVEGPPDIIFEVLSAESTAIDRGEKFVAYEAHGVREYWLIDPIRELADLYHLGPDGHYDEFRPDIAGRLRSRALRGFTLDLDLLWKRVLPTTADVVKMVEDMVAQR